MGNIKEINIKNRTYYFLENNGNKYLTFATTAKNKKC